MQTDAIVILARWQVKPGYLPHVMALLSEVAQASRREPGNQLYLAHQVVDDPHVLWLYEVYSDAAAVQAHRESTHFQNLVLQHIVPMLAAREVIRLQPLQ